MAIVQSEPGEARAGAADPKPLPSPTRMNWTWTLLVHPIRLFAAILFRYRSRGVEKLPETGGALLLINHQSHLDPVLVGLTLPRPISYIARDTLFNVPIIGWILKNTYVMPINREAASSGIIRESVRRIKHGFLVGIFPEGTRSEDGQIGEIKPGFIALIRRSQAPVYPVGVAGSLRAMPRHAKLPRATRVRVVIGDPLPKEVIEEGCRRGNEEYMLARVRERLIECQREAEEWLKR